jgi:hypothetical protein
MRMNTHRHTALALLLIVLTCGIAHAGTADETAITGILKAQVPAWNRGDVVAFMRG